MRYISFEISDSSSRLVFELLAILNIGGDCEFENKKN